MKKHILRSLLVLSTFLLFTLPTVAQVATGVNIPFGPILPSSCLPLSRSRVMYYKTGSAAGVYQCLTLNTWTLVGAGSGVPVGTVTSVTSANGDITVATGTTTPVLTVISAPKLDTARLIGGTSFDGTANITPGLATTVTTNANLTGPITSSGNATAVAAQTGTGSTFVMNTGPTVSGASLGSSSTATTQSSNDNSTKLATTAYVDSALATFDSKPQVAYASTSALPANTYSNGTSGVGATLTGTANGPLVIDGVTILVGQVGSRVLIAGEATSANNGWYTITQQGVVAVSPYILTRAVESDQAAEIGSGYLTSVVAPNGVTVGSANNGKVFISVAAADPFVVGTTNLTFSQVGSTYSAGNGLSLSGSAFSIDTSITVDKTTAQTLTNKTLTSPTLTTPSLGVATATSINGNTFTTGTYTLTGTAGKTLTFSNSLTLAGTDSTTMTFPTTSATVARTDAANTFTGHQTIEGVTSAGATGTGKFVFDTSPQISTIELGAASDTTLSRASAGVLAVEGVTVDTISGTNTLTNKTITNPTITTQALTDQATITWDMSSGGMATVTLAGNRTMAAPTNIKKGSYAFQITQDGTGSRTLTWNGVFKWASGVAPTLSTGAGKIDAVTCISFDGTNLICNALLDVR